MATVTFDVLEENPQETSHEITNVRGGAWYAKYDGVDGSSKNTVETRAIIAVCDGSVRIF